MSFSTEVKEELSNRFSSAKHCQIAEIAAIVMMCGRFDRNSDGSLSICVQTENLAVARKYFTLLRKAFNIYTNVCIRMSSRTHHVRTYLLRVSKQSDVERLFNVLKLSESGSGVNGLLIQRACCKRSFIRGAFLSAGSISDPKKFYHFEIVCSTSLEAEQIRMMINSFSVDAKIVVRKKNYIVYIKEGAQIVLMLNIMEAHISLMNLENLRIVKEMRNSVNRRVNCETANIHKTVSAAVKQLEDIRYISEHGGFGGLSDGLQEMAELRLEHPEATLKELGEMLQPPVGKSGVNHRLRKLSEFAEKLRR